MKNKRKSSRCLHPVCSVSLVMGAISDPIKKQLRAQGCRPIKATCAYWQRCADAITLLKIHGMITRTESNNARRRLIRQIHAGCSQNEKGQR